MSNTLSHISESGDARMVDVSDKAATQRSARATGAIHMLPSTLAAIVNSEIKKGDVLAVARIAGIMASKRTAELIPLCHPLAITSVEVELVADESLPGIRASATVKTTGPTGVEMEALTAVSVALMTVYDMAKAIDRGMSMCQISIVQKSGGASGDYFRDSGTGSAR